MNRKRKQMEYNRRHVFLAQWNSSMQHSQVRRNPEPEHKKENTSFTFFSSLFPRLNFFLIFTLSYDCCLQLSVISLITKYGLLHDLILSKNLLTYLHICILSQYGKGFPWQIQLLTDNTTVVERSQLCSYKNIAVYDRGQHIVGKRLDPNVITVRYKNTIK